MNCLLRNGELEVNVDELFWNWLNCVLLLRILWIWYMLSWRLGYWVMLMIKEWFEPLRLWIRICGYGLKWWTLWIVCVLIGNELIYLNGWLRYGKAREKMRLKAYAEIWD